MISYYLSLSLRELRRNVGFTVLMVSTIAIGIAAGMITTSLRHALSLDPIPGKSESLYSVQNPDDVYGKSALLSFYEAQSLAQAKQGRSESVITGAGILTSILVDGDNRQIDGGIGVRFANAKFFRVFDVSVRRGRTWSAAEEFEGAPVALVSSGVADLMFHSQDVIGKEFGIGHTQFRIIGITDDWNPRPRFYQLNSAAGALGGGGDGIFVPLTAIQYAPDDFTMGRTCTIANVNAIVPPISAMLSAPCSWLSVWYLLDERGELPALANTVKQQLAITLPKFRGSKLRLMNVREILQRADVIPESVRLYSFLGVIFLGLCLVNAAGMQLSRILRGSSAIGIRRALGASRRQIVVQFLCDSLLLGCLGGVLGVALTFAGLHVVRQIPSVAFADMVHMDASMLGLMVSLVLASSVLVGLMPAWIASRADPALVVKSAT